MRPRPTGRGLTVVPVALSQCGPYFPALTSRTKASHAAGEKCRTGPDAFLLSRTRRSVPCWARLVATSTQLPLEKLNDDLTHRIMITLL